MSGHGIERMTVPVTFRTSPFLVRRRDELISIEYAVTLYAYLFNKQCYGRDSAWNSLIHSHSVAFMGPGTIRLLLNLRLHVGKRRVPSLRWW